MRSSTPSQPDKNDTRAETFLKRGVSKKSLTRFSISVAAPPKKVLSPGIFTLQTNGHISPTSLDYKIRNQG